MRAILDGAVESSRVALGAIARTPGWTLPLVISLPRDFDGRHSDFADLSGPARAAGAEFLATRNINTPETLDAILAAVPVSVFVLVWSHIFGWEFFASAHRPVECLVGLVFFFTFSSFLFP